MPYIKIIVDKKKLSGLYWITGSLQFNLMKNISESLAGRVAILNLQGFSQKEMQGIPNYAEFIPTDEFINNKNIQKSINLNELYESIWKGSFPRINVSDTMNWEVFYSSYLQTYIERDICTITSIENELLFLHFMRAIAARSGQLLNYSDIAKNIGISNPTVKSWLSTLQTSGLVIYWNHII